MQFEIEIQRTCLNQNLDYIFKIEIQRTCECKGHLKIEIYENIETRNVKDTNKSKWKGTLKLDSQRTFENRK